MKQKIDYLLQCAKKRLLQEGLSCPSCAYVYSKSIDSKFLLTELHRCQQCSLLYRIPTTTVEENQSFYQEKYSQGLTTDIPNRQQLQKLIDTNFSCSEKDYSEKIKILNILGAEKGNKIFDFGCSWGYGSWQFKQYGFEVEAFEISDSRANFARNELKLKVHSTLSKVSNSFDFFFSSHVLEHVPSVKEVIDFGFSILKPGGIFVAFTPNGSIDHRNKNYYNWHKLWGAVHPNFLDNVYYENILSNKSFLLSSNPYDYPKFANWMKNTNEHTVLDLSGQELLVVAKK